MRNGVAALLVFVPVIVGGIGLDGSRPISLPVFSDQFTGPRLDQTQWDLFRINGAAATTGAGLRITTNGAQAYSDVNVYSLHELIGDFDVEVDFSLGTGWHAPLPAGLPGGHLNGAALAIYLDEPNWMTVFRTRGPNFEGFSFYSNVAIPGGSQSQFASSTSATGGLRVVGSGGRYRFYFREANDWRLLASVPAWNRPVRLKLGAANVNLAVTFTSTLGNLRITGGATTHVPYSLPTAFRHRQGFFIGGQFINAAIDRWISGMSSYRPMEQLSANGMNMARSCMTTISDPELAATAPEQWRTLGWKNSYWSSLEMVTQLFKDARAAGMRVNACYYLSDRAAHAGVQDTPPEWAGLSVADTANRVESYTYATTRHLLDAGIEVELYDVGNEIMYGILNFLPGDRVPLGGVDFSRSPSYMAASVWPIEAELLSAAIRGIRRADPDARVALHVESSNDPAMDMMYRFFESMQALGVPFDVAAISLPYMDSTDLSHLTPFERLYRFELLVNRIGALGLPVHVAESSYPAASVAGLKPAMAEYPYTDAGQSAYLRDQLLWASGNANVIGWTWFYPEWFVGITPSAPPVLAVSGLFASRTTFRPAASELLVMSRPVHTGPLISTIPDTFTAVGTPVTAAVRIVDVDTPVAALSVTAASDNTSLVPSSSVRIQATGTGHRMTVSPASRMSGSTRITVTVSDGVQSSASSFVFTALPAAGPTSLRASVEGQRVTFWWAGGTNSDDTQYVLEAGTSPGAPYVSLPVGNVLTTSVEAPSGRFYVRVRCTRTNEVTNEIAIAVGNAAPPDPPTVLLSGVDGTRVQLTWANTGGGGTRGGSVLEAFDTGGMLLAALSLPAEAESFTTIAPAGAYRVRVVNTGPGGRSAPSPVVELVVPGTCAPPAAPLALSTAVSQSNVTVGWELGAAGTAAPQYYVLSAGHSSGATDVRVITQSRRFTAIAPPGTYYVRVKAANSCGESADSGEVVVVVP